MTAIEETLPPAPIQRVRRQTVLRLLATGLLITTDALLIMDIAIWGGQRFRPPPVSFIQGQAIIVAEMFFAFAYGVMGWLLATRVWRNPLGWLFQLMGLGMAAQMVITFQVQAGHQAFRALDPLLLDAAWAGSTFHLPITIVLASFIFALFPHGEPLSRRWGWAMWLAVAGAAIVCVSIAFSPQGLTWYPTLPNPFAAPAAYEPLLSAVGAVGLALLIAAVTISASSIAIRYRHADHEGKTQIRWIAGAVLLIAICGIPFLVGRYLLHLDYASGEVLLSVTLAAGCSLPIAAAIAVLRYNLYDIDLIINKALVYIPLTGFLGGIYAAGVALFQKLFVTLTGDRSDAAIVITTLVLASMFTPVRNWLQAFVDRRFKPVNNSPIVEGSNMDMLRDRIEALEAKVNRLSE